MIEEDEQMNNNTRTLIKETNDPTMELYTSLQNSFSMFNQGLVDHKDLSYKMIINKITADDIVNEMEAKMFNWKNGNSNGNLDDININQWLNESLDSQIKKHSEEIHKHNKMRGMQGKQPAKKNLAQIANIPINLNIKHTLAFPENDSYVHVPSDYNSYSIKCEFYSSYEIKEYPLIPKDEWESEDAYIKYFNNMRTSLLEKLNIAEDDALLNVTKFVFIVNFDTTDSKPIPKDIRLIDPLNNFARYKIKYEKKSLIESYLVSGQIIYIEGDIMNDEIQIRCFSQGFPSETYIIQETALKQIFIESSPYLIYAINGPFYTNEDIDLSIFSKVLDNMSESNPHCVIINGPFINTENERIKQGDIDMNYFSLFEIMLEIINKAFKDKRAIVLISPSLSDVLNYYPLPQPPFNIAEIPHVKQLDLYKGNRMKFISNPQTFQLNEMIVGIANFDIIKDVNANCIRIDKIKAPIDIGLEMVLNQKNYYPLLQNSFNNIDENKMDKMTTVDIGQYEKMTFEINPDIVITSSSFTPFAKKSEATLFINSGAMYKGKMLGSYARIISYPPSSFVGTDIMKRTRVDLCKIEGPKILINE